MAYHSGDDLSAVMMQVEALEMDLSLGGLQMIVLDPKMQEKQTNKVYWSLPVGCSQRSCSPHLSKLLHLCLSPLLLGLHGKVLVAKGLQE